MSYDKAEKRPEQVLKVVYMRADQTGGWVGTPCIKIGYSSREPRKVPRPSIEIGYSSAMY